MNAATLFLGIAAILAATVVAVWLLQRSVTRDGVRRGGAIGDGLGNLIDVFEPGQARAQRDLQDQRHQGPVTPTPDPDPDDPVRIELGPGGVPRSITIRRKR